MKKKIAWAIVTLVVLAFTATVIWAAVQEPVAAIYTAGIIGFFILFAWALTEISDA